MTSWRRSGVFIVSFEHISHVVLMLLSLTFEQVNAGWEGIKKDARTTAQRQKHTETRTKTTEITFRNTSK